MIVFFCFVSYFFGSIPFGLLLAKIKKIDIRSIGSGNIGATNVARAMGKKYAFLVFLLDGIKGAVPVFCAEFFANLDSFSLGLVGFFAVLGHVFSFWLKFKGGKGVATTFLTFLAINSSIGIGIMLIWLSIFLVTRYSSLAAIISLTIGVLLSVFSDDLATILFSILTYLLIMYKHIPNIKRLLRGAESKF